jgi:hypothetical protein
MSELADLVERSLTGAAREEFESRVDAQAAFLRDAIERGELDADGFAVGLELEVYAVDETGALSRIPESVFDACNKELGLHNAELNTDPDPFTTEGIEDQAASLHEQWRAARRAADDAGLELVLDSMWTIPPAEGSEPYLSSLDDYDGVPVPSNMRPDPRYAAIDRDSVRHADGGPITFDVPGASVEFPSILFESLATSIQPHVQVPDAEAFPTYYNVAIRTLGPVLALGTNSPFLPPDLYDDPDPATLLAETHHELRIAAFEQSVNQTPNRKVRVPEDIETPTDVVDGVVADDLVAPFLSEWLDDEREGAVEPGSAEAFADNVPEFDHKRGTYWRWLRCVAGGDPVPGVTDERSLRIEYRPIPTQPTVDDIVGFQCLVGGLVHGLVVEGHPIRDLPWAAAERAFYEAVEDGLDGDLAWVTGDGERTTDPAIVYDEVFDYARRGLADLGIDEATVATYLDPLEARWTERTTPSRWKIEQVREELDGDADLADAILSMQEEYIRLSREHETFADWL